jgi:hypothetical protein
MIATCPFWTVPFHICSQCTWGPAHHAGHNFRLSPSHIHVWRPLLKSVSHQPPSQRFLWTSSHISKSLSTKVASFRCIFSLYFQFWTFSLGCSNLWPLCEHLPTCALHGHHQCLALCIATSVVRVYVCPHFHFMQLNVVAAVFLHWLRNPSLFCELNQVVHHACSDTFFNDVVIYFLTYYWFFFSLGGILYSYSKIDFSIHTIPAVQRKYKA